MVPFAVFAKSYLENPPQGCKHKNSSLNDEHILVDVKEHPKHEANIQVGIEKAVGEDKRADKTFDNHAAPMLNKQKGGRNLHCSGLYQNLTLFNVRTFFKLPS